MRKPPRTFLAPTITVSLIAVTVLVVSLPEASAGLRGSSSPSPARIASTASDLAKIRTPRPPSATTTKAYEINGSGAIVTGSFNPRGQRTIFRFAYGRTEHYERFAPLPVEEEWFGTRTEKVEQVIECLRPHTTYHYRIVATNPSGVGKGKDHTFTTTGNPEPDPYPGC